MCAITDIVEKQCLKHGFTEFSVEVLVDGDGCRKIYRCLQCQAELDERKLLKRKIRAIRYKGSQCAKCGMMYTGYPSIFEFKHIDENTKDFDVSTVGLHIPWIRICVELDKCIMLCTLCC